jgi:hypothetical protein
MTQVICLGSSQINNTAFSASVSEINELHNIQIVISAHAHDNIGVTCVALFLSIGSFHFSTTSCFDKSSYAHGIYWLRTSRQPGPSVSRSNHPSEAASAENTEEFFNQ